MTLRDKFAEAALIGWAAGRNNGDDMGKSDPAYVAQSCYLYADAMLAEREKK